MMDICGIVVSNEYVIGGAVISWLVIKVVEFFANQRRSVLTDEERLKANLVVETAERNGKILCHVLDAIKEISLTQAMIVRTLERMEQRHRD